MFFSSIGAIGFHDVHPPPLRRSVAGLEFDGFEPLHESVGRRGRLELNRWTIKRHGEAMNRYEKWCDVVCTMWFLIIDVSTLSPSLSSFLEFFKHTYINLSW